MRQHDPYSRLRYRAKRELAARRPDEYRALLEEYAGDPHRCDKARNAIARLHPDEYRQLLTEQHLLSALEVDES